MQRLKCLLAGATFAVLLAASAEAEPATYHLEKTHVDLLFDVSHLGFSKKHGSFRSLDATLTYDPQKPAASSVTVTVRADSIDTGDAARDSELKGDKFFAAAKYPQIRFVSTKVTPGAAGGFEILGDLTLHGVTKSITLHATLNKAGANPFDKKPTLGFSAAGTLKRSDFGIAGLVPMIGDEVAITIDAEFNHAP